MGNLLDVRLRHHDSGHVYVRTRGIALHQHGVELEKERQRRYSATGARLRNWGLAYRGGSPRVSLGCPMDDDRPTLDELDAAVVERAMLDLLSRCNKETKLGRGYWKLYRLGKLMYLQDEPPVILAQVFRCPEHYVDRLHGRLLDYIATYLEIGMAEE